MLALVFPGQGAQRPGMGLPWVDDDAWQLVRDASRLTGIELEHLLLRAGADELQQTRNAQLATFLVSLMALEAVRRSGPVEPAAVMGHSQGEYTALVAAGALSFNDAVVLVAERSEAMQAACDTAPGGMAAVSGLDEDSVESACSRTGGLVSVANYNAPLETVIAGPNAALATAFDEAMELGAKSVRLLSVSGAFHTSAMAPACERLRHALNQARFTTCPIPVVANVDARPHFGGERWRDLLLAQLCTPVRWRQSLQWLANNGITRVLELGPGRALGGFARGTVRTMETAALDSPEGVEALRPFIDGDPVELEPVGEHVHICERLVISHITGLFEPMPPSQQAVTTEGEIVSAGDAVALVGGEPVRSQFTGWLMGLLAIPGERVTAGQPVAWIRV